MPMMSNHVRVGEYIRFLINGIILIKDFTPLKKEINNDYLIILKQKTLDKSFMFVKFKLSESKFKNFDIYEGM